MTRPKLTGRQIMDWRQGLGKPRRWLAERLDVSPKTIESWEYETRNPGGPALLLLEQLMSSPLPEESAPHEN
jgi:DNA-binding transcriptional regulator YiaG